MVAEAHNPWILEAHNPLFNALRSAPPRPGPARAAGPPSAFAAPSTRLCREREFCIDNILVRIHEIIWWTSLAPWQSECPFPGGLISTGIAPPQRGPARGADPPSAFAAPSTRPCNPRVMRLSTHVCNQRVVSPNTHHCNRECHRTYDVGSSTEGFQRGLEMKDLRDLITCNLQVMFPQCLTNGLKSSR
jgi:hypothetical protein